MDYFRGALPLEKICRFLLNEKFSKLLKQKITKDQLTLDVPSGTLTVKDIDLNPSLFNSGRKSLLLRAAHIGNVQIHMAGKAAKSFFADTVHDNLIVKVSDIRVELDIFTDVDSDATQQASDEEGLYAAILTAVGVSSTAPVSVEDSWSELEAQMPSDSDGREQLSHIIKQFLLLAEFEIAGLSVLCNLFRSGRRYDPTQFRITVDSARLLNDFSHLEGKRMPSSSVEHLTHIVFGRQLSVGSICVDLRDCLANHCAAASFEDQPWVPIFSARLSPLSNIGCESVPFCKLQFQLKGFESDLHISILKIDICFDDVQMMLDAIQLQLLLSCAKILHDKSNTQDSVNSFASRQSTDAGLSERGKCVRNWLGQPGSIEDTVTICIKSVSFLVACIDQPLRNKKRRPLDSNWLCTLQGVRVIAGIDAIEMTSDIALFQELLWDGSRNEIIRISCNASMPLQQCGICIKVACDGSNTDVQPHSLKILLADVQVVLDFDLLHRLNAAFYWHVKSLQALFSKSQSSSSSLSIHVSSAQFDVRIPEEIIRFYHVQHSAGVIIVSIHQLLLRFHTDRSFESTFDSARLNLLPDFVIIRRLVSIPNTFKYRTDPLCQSASPCCINCDVSLGNVDARLSIQMRPLIFALGSEFEARLPQPPMNPAPLGKNFMRKDAGEERSSDDDQCCDSPLGHESMLRSSMYVSAHSRFPLQESASFPQTTDPTLLPLYLVLMRNALHAMGASFSGQESVAPESLKSVQNLFPEVSLPINYRFSALFDSFIFALAGATTLPDSNPCPAPIEPPFFCGLNSSYRTKLAELDATDSLVILSQRLEVLVSVSSSPSSTVSQLKFGSCQIIDSFDRVHLEPFYPFDGILPPQSVSDEDRRENGQVAVIFESGGNSIEIKFTQLLLHYGHCNWIDCIIRFFKGSQPQDLEAVDRNQENSEVHMNLKFKHVAFQPALLPAPFTSPRRLFIEEASVQLMPGADDILKTISINSKALHLMVAPHVNHVIACCNSVITGARNAHLNAVDLQSVARQGNSASQNPDISRLLRPDCTLDWQRMLPLDFSSSCGFLCVASIPTLQLVKKSSSDGLILELHDIELVVFTCADSLARVLVKASCGDDDVVIIENPRPSTVDESNVLEASDEVVLSPHSKDRLVEEEYRTSSVQSALSADGTSYGYLGEVYDNIRTSLASHWSHVTGPGQVDTTTGLYEAEVQKELTDERSVSFDESFMDIGLSSNLSASPAASFVQLESSGDGDRGGAPFENMLEPFLSWRLELVNARVRFRMFAGYDFPEYVDSEEADSPSSSSAAASLRVRDMDRSLELQVEGMHLRYSCFTQAASMSSSISFRAQDIKIADNVSDSFFRFLIQKDESFLECGAYERDALLISFTLDTLQNNTSGSDTYEKEQRRFEAHVLPLVCSLDERTKDTILDLLAVYSNVTYQNEMCDSSSDWDAWEDKIVYQKFIISALNFRCNYKPIRTAIILRDSPVTFQSVKLWNCPSGQVLENIVKQWGGWQEIVMQFLGAFANSFPVVSNVTHIFRALNILIQQSVRNRSSARKVRRNVFAFLSALSGEVIDVALIASRVADQLLSSASSVVRGNAGRDRQRRSTGSAAGAKEAQMLQALQEDLKKIQQPANVQEGLQEALHSFSHGLECMMMTVSQPGHPIRRGAAAVLMPMQGMNRGVFQFLQGLINQLQPQRRARREEKYKDSYDQQKK